MVHKKNNRSVHKIEQMTEVGMSKWGDGLGELNRGRVLKEE